MALVQIAILFMISSPGTPRTLLLQSTQVLHELLEMPSAHCFSAGNWPIPTKKNNA
jgi:hypothetical protein